MTNWPLRGVFILIFHTRKKCFCLLFYTLFMVVRKRRTEHHRFSKKHDRRSIIATELLVVVNRWSLTFIITFDFLQNPSLSSHYQHRGNLLHEFGFVQKRLQKAQLWYVKSQEILCGARIVRFKTIIESVVDKKNHQCYVNLSMDDRCFDFTIYKGTLLLENYKQQVSWP